jgi:hypothetical protein
LIFVLAFIEKAGRKETTRKTKDRWEDGMRMDLGVTGSGWEPVASCCECSDKPEGSGATELAVIGIYFTTHAGCFFILPQWLCASQLN